MLLANDADVLLTACCFARRCDLLVCYLPVTARLSIPLFKKLVSIIYLMFSKRMSLETCQIEDVVGIPVSTITSTLLAVNVEEEVKSFFASRKHGLLLLPESVCPQIDVDPLRKSCMIHVGWPSRQEQCTQHNFESRSPWQLTHLVLDETQVKNHNMQHSVLVAFAEDKDMYPSGSTVIAKTKPWPDGEIMRRTEIPALRPQFRTKMSEIPLRMKERLYPVRFTLRV
jgi:hypothetical protein